MRAPDLVGRFYLGVAMVMKAATAGLLLLALAQGCVDRQLHPLAGGPCSYETVKGRAHILAIEPHTDGAKVFFRFEGAGTVAPSKAVEGNGMVVFPLAPGYPTKVRIGSRLAEVGDRVPCARDEIQTGTCTPVVYRFED